MQYRQLFNSLLLIQGILPLVSVFIAGTNTFLYIRIFARLIIEYIKYTKCILCLLCLKNYCSLFYTLYEPEFSQRICYKKSNRRLQISVQWVVWRICIIHARKRNSWHMFYVCQRLTVVNYVPYRSKPYLFNSLIPLNRMTNCGMQNCTFGIGVSSKVRNISLCPSCPDLTLTRLTCYAFRETGSLLGNNTVRTRKQLVSIECLMFRKPGRHCTSSKFGHKSMEISPVGTYVFM